MAEVPRTVSSGEPRTIAQIEASDWKTGYVTQEYVKRVNKKIRDTEVYIGKGKCLSRDNAEATLGNTAYEIGRLKGLNDALDIAEAINS